MINLESKNITTTFIEFFKEILTDILQDQLEILQIQRIQIVSA